MVAYVLNRPQGQLDDADYRLKVENKALKDLITRMKTLDECCGVMGAYFGASTQDMSRPHYYKASSDTMKSMVEEEVSEGIIGRVIAQKHRPIPQKKQSKRQWYTAFMNDIVKSAGKPLVIVYKIFN